MTAGSSAAIAARWEYAPRSGEIQGAELVAARLRAQVERVQSAAVKATLRGVRWERVDDVEATAAFLGILADALTHAVLAGLGIEMDTPRPRGAYRVLGANGLTVWLDRAALPAPRVVAAAGRVCADVAVMMRHGLHPTEHAAPDEGGQATRVRAVAAHWMATMAYQLLIVAAAAERAEGVAS